MAVSSRITLNHSLIRNLDSAAVRSLEMTAEALHTEVVQAEIMPRDTGAMQNEKTFVDTRHSGQGHVSIVTEGPYARRLYFHPEYDFQKWENAFAQAKWYDPWLPGGISQDFARNAFEKLYKKEARL